MRTGTKILLWSLAGIGVAAGALALAGRAFSAPRYEGPVNDHFDGTRFHNLEPVPHSTGAFLKWMASREQGFWPDFVASEPGPKPPVRIGRDELRVTFVNHATVLIQFDGINVLTDPIWSERTSPVSFAGPRRRRPPGIRFEDLPPLDAVLISHNHYDHMDRPTLRRLSQSGAPPLYVGLGNDRFLELASVGPAIPLDWWESRPLPNGMRVWSVPAQHFSARGTTDRDANLWCGFVLESAAGDAVYFAGDTGEGPHFEMIAERFPRIRLAILPIGAFLPRWFMAPVHIGPEEAIRAHRTLGAVRSMVMHFGTFPLGDDGFEEAPQLLRTLLRSLPERERSDIWIPGHGESRDF
ncbi:MAG: MBL fold metallo-hydrolase [Thermoanaerobaculia bacterium]